MMHNDSNAILNDLLGRWHAWQLGVPINAVDRMDDPMFRNAKSRATWDSADEILDQEVHKKTMKAIDFQVSGDNRGQGGMAEPHRTAIYILARNCHTGHKVWASKRLPEDPEELGIIIQEARNIITRRLMEAGVM